MSGDTKTSIRFAIDGALTIRTTAETAPALRKQLNKRQAKVELDVSSVTEIDVSGIQLLLAARASALKAGKTLTIAQPLPEPVRVVLQQGGFLAAEGGTDMSDSFWLGKGME
jgi:ABC-type transporter Mla MlaB component